MIELIYPIESAKVLGPQEPGGEWVPIVEQNGLVVAQGQREWVHTSPERPVHPVVHLFVVDRYSRWYLQHRGPEVESNPGLWDISVGGHVGYGELYEEALYREAAEELALYDFNPQYVDTYLYASESCRELVNVYAAIGSFSANPDNFEVDEGRWWTMDEIKEAFGTGVFTDNFEMEYRKYRKKILSML